MSEKSVAESQPRLSPAKRWSFRLLAVMLSLLVCFVFLEAGLRIWGPKYYRFNNVSREYYSNPRGYFDVVRKEGRWTIYGVPVRQIDLPPGVVPDEGQCEQILEMLKEMPAVTVVPESMTSAASRLAEDANQELKIWPSIRIPEEIRDGKALHEFLSRKNTILGIGDSFTAGSGVRYEDTYLRQLEKRFLENGRKIYIKNAADLGDDLEDVYDTYSMESSQRHYPLVIYGFVLNDFGLGDMSQIVGSDYIDINNGGVIYSPLRRYCATWNFVAHAIDAIRLDRITRRRYLEAFRGENGRKGFGLLADLNRQVRSDQSRLVIVLFPLLYNFDHYEFQEIHDKMAAFCTEQGIPLLDLLPAFSQYEAQELWVHPTDHHPNEIAHRIVAGELYEFLNREGLVPEDS